MYRCHSLTITEYSVTINNSYPTTYLPYLFSYLTYSYLLPPNSNPNENTISFYLFLFVFLFLDLVIIIIVALVVFFFFFFFFFLFFSSSIIFLLFHHLALVRFELCNHRQNFIVPHSNSSQFNSLNYFTPPFQFPIPLYHLIIHFIHSPSLPPSITSNLFPIPYSLQFPVCYHFSYFLLTPLCLPSSAFGSYAWSKWTS